MHLAHSLVCLIGITVVTASSNNNYFTSPISSTGVRPVFTLGDQLLVSWITELDEFNVSFWQQSLVQESAASQGNIYCMSERITKGKTSSASENPNTM
jgi:hypothetical protein